MRFPFYFTISLALLTVCIASVGDRSYVFQRCVGNCNHYNCTGDRMRKFSENQSICHRLLQWSCTDECRYTCMWVTVDAFQKDGLSVPQFNGKWPFVRLFGVQEPASMIFSVLNGLAHLSIFWYRKHIPSTTPMYYIWHGMCLTAMNAWFWSTIFHSRDTPFTEKMDYFSAFSIVLYNTFTLACRFVTSSCRIFSSYASVEDSWVLGTVQWWRPLFVGFGCSVFFIQHITYLSYGRFDYGYNMKVNIGVAVFNMIGWLIWCIYIRKNRYIWKALLSIFGIQMLLSLELWDFPPLHWTFDAHSLWHGGSWPLAILWYSFIIDDGKALMKNKGYGVLPQTLKMD